jgi:modification methylase
MVDGAGLTRCLTRSRPRNVALLAGLREQRLVGQASFFQIDNTRKYRAAGLPVQVVAHEDILVFRQSTSPTRSPAAREHG